MDDLTCLVDDLGPLPVVRPASVAEVQAAVRRAAADRQAVYPLGGRTQLHVGLPPTQPGVGLDLTALDRIVDYPARDMTITVQAGLRVADLQRLLAAENQRLPVDVPHAERATVGGSLAVNVSGPRRYGLGTLRDYVLGMSAVNDDGQETKAGGRVVKNVAGYDLCKLHIGALGTLGVLTQVTLKLRPRPETSALLALGCPAGGLEGLLEQVHRSRARPVAVEVLDQQAARLVGLPEAPWVVLVGFEDSEDAVAWQLQQLIREAAAELGRAHAWAGWATDPLWDALTELTDHPRARLVFKATVLPGRVAAFCIAARPFEEVLLHAHAGSGIVRGTVLADLTRERAAEMLKALGEWCRADGGNLTVPRCPTAWKHDLPVWGRPKAGWLMRTVHDKLAPRRLFNPGRFLEGI
jgi:glycolate oxidase FAD binding subunit